jgi:hypothetical protein
LQLILFCFSQIPKPIANETEKLREDDVMDTSWLFGVVKVCGGYLYSHWSFVAVTGFVILVYFLLRKRSTVKLSITRVLSKTQSVYKSNAFL